LSAETSAYREVDSAEVKKLKELGIILEEIDHVSGDREDPRMFIYITTGYQPAAKSPVDFYAVAGEYVETVQVAQSRSAWSG
jgi:hypothetical protein